MKVLLVDDEQIEIATMVDYVNWGKLGVSQVTTACSGKAALEKLRTFHPDLVITDIQMPGMSGIELARVIRMEDEHAKVAFLTGYDDFQYIKAAFDLAVIDYILKPIDAASISKLVTRVRQAMANEKLIHLSREQALKQYIELVCKQEEGTLAQAQQELFRQGATEKHGLAGLYGQAEHWPADLGEAPPVYSTFWHEGMLVVLLNEHVTQQLAQDLLARAGEKSSLLWYPGLHSLDEMPGLVNAMVQAQHQLFYAAPGQCLCAEGLSPAPRQLPPVQNRDFFGRIAQAVCDGDQEAACTLAASFLEAFFAAPPQTCVHKALQLYHYLFHHVEMLQAGCEEDPQALRSEEKGLANAVFFDDLKHLLQGYIERLITMRQLSKRAPSNYIINRIHKYIDQHYARVFNMDELAGELHLSASYIRALYRSATGETVHDHLQKKRMEKAAELLRDGTQKVKDVSSQVGYDNVSYFTQSFQKWYGVTPNEYRQKH